MSPAAFALATALATAVLVGAEWAGARRLAAIAKPIASSGFVGVAVAAGALGSPYGRAVLAALALGWLGDVLLIPPGRGPAFLAGLTSFLLGHAVYAWAFALRPLSAAAALVSCPLLVLGAWGLLRWLRPHLPADLQIPVHVYAAAVFVMALLGLAASGGTGDLRVAAGALAFAASDVFVARERFVTASPWNAGVGLPLYYAAQLLLAGTVAGVQGAPFS